LQNVKLDFIKTQNKQKTAFFYCPSLSHNSAAAVSKIILLLMRKIISKLRKIETKFQTSLSQI